MSPVDRTSSRRRWSYLFWLRVVEIMLPSSHLPLMASQGKLEQKYVASQIPELESGENSRRKLQNVVTDSPADDVRLNILTSRYYHRDAA